MGSGWRVVPCRAALPPQLREARWHALDHDKGIHHDTPGDYYHSQGDHHDAQGDDDHSQGDHHDTPGDYYHSQGDHHAQGDYYHSQADDYHPKGDHHDTAGDDDHAQGDHHDPQGIYDDQEAGVPQRQAEGRQRVLPALHRRQLVLSRRPRVLPGRHRQGRLLPRRGVRGRVRLSPRTTPHSFLTPFFAFYATCCFLDACLTN